MTLLVGRCQQIDAYRKGSELTMHRTTAQQLRAGYSWLETTGRMKVPTYWTDGHLGQMRSVKHLERSMGISCIEVLLSLFMWWTVHAYSLWEYVRGAYSVYCVCLLELKHSVFSREKCLRVFSSSGD